MEAAVPASAKAPSTLEAAVSAEAALVWWLDTLVGQGDGVGLSGAGRFVGEDIPSTFRGGGTYTLTVDSNSAVLVLKDYFDNGTTFRGSGASTNLVGTYTGTWS